MTDDEMVGWHHQLDGHDFEQAPGVGNGRESLACCSPRFHKELDKTERLNGLKLLAYSQSLTDREKACPLWLLCLTHGTGGKP